MKGRVLGSKVMIPVSRLPLSLSFFSLLEFWSYRPCNYDNYFYFSSMHMLFFDDEFHTVYVLCVCHVCCLCLCNTLYLW